MKKLFSLLMLAMATLFLIGDAPSASARGGGGGGGRGGRGGGRNSGGGGRGATGGGRGSSRGSNREKDVKRDRDRASEENLDGCRRDAENDAR